MIKPIEGKTYKYVIFNTYTRILEEYTHEGNPNIRLKIVSYKGKEPVYEIITI